MKNELINFFRKPFNVCSLIGGTIGTILFFIFFFFEGGFSPPTEEDFSALHEQENKIIEDFNNVYSMENTEISITEQEIIVEIISTEESDYLVKMIFSKEREFVSSEEISNKPGYKTYSASKWIDRLTPWILILVMGIYAGGLGLGCGIYIIYKVYIKIKRAFQN